MNVGDMAKEVGDLTHETTEAGVLIPIINDAVHNLWVEFMKFALSQITGGPVSISFATGEERKTIVSIADPISSPTGSTFAGGILLSRSYSVTYTYVTDSGSETLESPALSLSPAGNFLARVDSPVFVEGAIGWNVYAGTVTGRRCKQNDAPLSFGQQFDEPPSGFVDEPQRPSPPIINTTGDDIGWIRMIEVETPDGARKPWFSADLNSDMMRRFARAIPINSPFQGYAFDLLNGRVIEIRPPSAGAIDSRYFYVKKPRRIRYESSLVPFADFPACWSFIKYVVVSIVCLSNHEYEASREWRKMAGEQKFAAVSAMTATLHDKDLTVTPYLR